MDERFRKPRPLNVLAVAGVAFFALLAAGALFALPSLRDLGLSFRASFVLVSAVEFVAAIGAGLSAYRLYEDPED